MALEIATQSFEDLTEAERLDVPNNGIGKEYASYLRILHNSQTIGLFSDAMEPEDCRFYRDLSWVKNIIRTAYELGFEDAKEETPEI